MSRCLAGRSPRARSAPSDLPLPVRWITWTPCCARCSIAPAVAALRLAAPVEPPVTNNVGASASQPHDSRARARSSPRAWSSASLSGEISDRKPHRKPRDLRSAQRRALERHSDGRCPTQRRAGSRFRARRCPRAPPSAPCDGARRGRRESKRSRRIQRRPAASIASIARVPARTADPSRDGSFSRSIDGRRGKGTLGTT